MSPALHLRARARRLPILLLVLLLHALLLGLLLRSRADTRQAPRAPAELGVLLRLLPLPVLQRPGPGSPPAKHAGPPARRADTPNKSSAPTAAPTASQRPRPTAEDGLPTRAEAQPAANASPDTPPTEITTAPASGASLLDSEGTRRAIRQASREPLLAERAASATDEPGRRNSQQRLAQGIAAGANGDCLKGEFAGGGMGLLSLPFWALAEARGKCRR